MMKKLFALLLVLALVSGCAAPCLAEDGYVKFVPDMLNAMEYTAEEWMESGLDRAFLTLLFVLDVAMNDDVAAKYDLTGIDADTVTNSFTGISEEGYLVIWMWNDAHDYICTYWPGGLVASITVSAPGSGEAFAESVLKENCARYYRNSADDLNTVAGIINEALEDDE